MRNFAPSFPTFFFDHGRALDEKSDVEVHRSHVRQNFTLILKNKLYANLKECIYVQALHYFVGTLSVKTAYALIRKRSRRSPSDLPVNINGLSKVPRIDAFLHKYLAIKLK